MSTMTAPASALRPPTTDELDPEERMSRAEIPSVAPSTKSGKRGKFSRMWRWNGLSPRSRHI